MLYFGDSLWADLVEARKLHGWTTGAIIYDVELELEKMASPVRYRHACSLAAFCFPPRAAGLLYYRCYDTVAANSFSERDGCISACLGGRGVSLVSCFTCFGGCTLERLFISGSSAHELFLRLRRIAFVLRYERESSGDVTWLVELGLHVDFLRTVVVSIW